MPAREVPVKLALRPTKPIPADNTVACLVDDAHNRYTPAATHKRQSCG